MHALFNLTYETVLLCIANHGFLKILESLSQPSITWSKLTIETLEQGVKYVQN